MKIGYVNEWPDETARGERNLETQLGAIAGDGVDVIVVETYDNPAIVTRASTWAAEHTWLVARGGALLSRNAAFEAEYTARRNSAPQSC